MGASEEDGVRIPSSLLSIVQELTKKYKKNLDIWFFFANFADA